MAALLSGEGSGRTPADHASSRPTRASRRISPTAIAVPDAPPAPEPGRDDRPRPHRVISRGVIVYHGVCGQGPPAQDGIPSSHTTGRRSPAAERGVRCPMLGAVLRVLALAYKELLAVLKDPRGRATLFIPPILQCLIYGYVATYDLNDVPYAVLDQDRSAASRDLLAGLDGSGVFRRVADLHRAADVKTWIDERRALLVVQIDQDFERR